MSGKRQGFIKITTQLVEFVKLFSGFNYNNNNNQKPIVLTDNPYEIDLNNTKKEFKIKSRILKIPLFVW